MFDSTRGFAIRSNIMKLASLLVTVLWTALTALSNAAPKITGGTSYKFGANNATVTMNCDAIGNTSTENATGTIQVQLWALSAPFSGGKLSGVMLGTYKLEGLEGGKQYSAFSKTVKATLPKTRGSYHICLTVSEYRGQGYVIADWRNFPNPVTLAPARLFTMEAPWSWQTNPEAGTVNMKVKKISHTRATNTGTLRLGIWATNKPYTGGSINGYQLGYVQKQPLKAGFVYTDVDNTAKLKKPPAGTYYVTLVLMEFSKEDYSIVAWLSSTKPSIFK